MVSFHLKKQRLQRWNAEKWGNGVHFKKVLLQHWKAEIASRVVVPGLQAAPRDPTALAADEDARGKQKRGPKRKYDDLGKGPSDGDGGGAAPPALAAATPASTSRNPTAPASSRRRRRSADEDARGKEKRETPERKERGPRKGKPSDDGGGGSAPPAAAAPPASTSRGTSAPPLQSPRAADEDTDGGPDNHGDFREEGNDKEALLALVQKHSEDHIIVEKIEIISQRYEHFRRTSEDNSSCFYRAFLFSYLENLGQMQDRQAEVTRLMKHVATSKKTICGLKLDKAYFSNPNVSSVMAEFNTLVDSVANGLSSDELFKSCLEATRSPRIISLLRLLAETDIRTSRREEYKSLYRENFDAIAYCCTMVRPMDAQASEIAIRALTYALGIPLRVESVDRRSKDQIVKVERLDFFPRLEPGKGPDHWVLSYWRSVTAPTPEEMGSCDLLSVDRTPLLTLMLVRKPKRRRWYILYRKRTNHASVL